MATTNKKSPFMFDPKQFQEMFKLPDFEKMFSGMQMPGVDMNAVLAAQQKNVEALVEANKVAMAGYQEIFQRQVALVEAAIADAQAQMGGMQGQQPTAEQAQKNIETMRSSMEKALSNARELAELAQKANTGAFDVIRARFDEAVAEFTDAAKKMGQ
jgi:phasin family protein